MSSGSTVNELSAHAAKTRAAGFTLLEVIVSMVLISLVGMAAYALINSSVANLGHIKEHLDRVQIVRNALAYMEQVNPMDDKSGTAELGPYKVHWKAEIVQPKVWNKNDSYYEVALYKTHVTVKEKGKNH